MGVEQAVVEREGSRAAIFTECCKGFQAPDCNKQGNEQSYAFRDL